LVGQYCLPKQKQGVSPVFVYIGKNGANSGFSLFCSSKKMVSKKWRRAIFF